MQFLKKCNTSKLSIEYLKTKGLINKDCKMININQFIKNRENDRKVYKKEIKKTCTRHCEIQSEIPSNMLMYVHPIQTWYELT